MLLIMVKLLRAERIKNYKLKTDYAQMWHQYCQSVEWKVGEQE